MGIWNRDYMGPGSRLNIKWGPIQIIIAINVAVFLAWQLARPMGAVSFFNDLFMTSGAHLERGMFWTLLTAAFSHNQVFHIFFNMFVLYMFGRVVESELGRKSFWRFYIGAAIFASAVHVVLCYVKMPAAMLGASGAIAGVVTLFAVRHPHQKLYLFMLIPMPAWVLVAAMGCVDLYGLIFQLRGGGGNIGHAAHLGGAAFGLIYHFGIVRGGFTRRRRRREPRREIYQLPQSQPRQDSRPEPRPQSRDERQMDELLEKISKHGGYDKLPQSEREVLEDLSRRLRERD